MKNKLSYILPSLVVGVVIGILLMYYIDFSIIRNEKAIDNRTYYSIDDLKNNVLMKGDVDSYWKLHGIYRDESSEDFLYWAMLMANKYDYPNAYEDVYYCIEESYTSDSAIFKMDEKTRTFALHYLRLAAQKNDTSALDKIKELKAKNIPPSWLK